MRGDTEDPYAPTLPARAFGVARRLLRRAGFDITRHPSRLSYEWQLTLLLRKLDTNCVLDVGANEGQFASFLRRSGFDGWIVSFEPIPEVFARLQRRMSHDPKWRGVNCALGEREYEAELNVAGGDAQASSILPLNDVGPERWGDALRVQRTVKVPVRTLAAILDEVTAGVPGPKRLYLKMDTQGFDLRVVEGLGSRVAELPALQSELSLTEFYEGMTHFPEALRRYIELGYAVVGFYPLSREMDQLRVIEFDVMLMRPGAERR